MSFMVIMCILDLGQHLGGTCPPPPPPCELCACWAYTLPYWPLSLFHILVTHLRIGCILLIFLFLVYFCAGDQAYSRGERSSATSTRLSPCHLQTDDRVLVRCFILPVVLSWTWKSGRMTGAGGLSAYRTLHVVHKSC